VRSVLFVLYVGRKAVSGIAHAAEESLRKGQNVGKALLKF
jgi:hypothetical protein